MIGLGKGGDSFQICHMGHFGYLRLDFWGLSTSISSSWGGGLQLRHLELGSKLRGQCLRASVNRNCRRSGSGLLGDFVDEI